MKYMIMMFGSAEGMMETADPAWIQEMIGFMIQIDKDLTESGEMVFNAGLADGSTAKLVKQTPDGVLAGIELSVFACQHGKDLRRQAAQQVLDPCIWQVVQLDLRRSFLDRAQLNHLRVLDDA